MLFSHDATPLPPLLRKQEQWFPYVLDMMLFIGPALIILSQRFFPDFFVHTGFMVLFGQTGVWGVPLLLFVLLALGFRLFGRRTRLNAAAEKYDYLLCGSCAYVLTHAPDSEKCPECGSRFRRDLLASYWSRFTRRQTLHRVIPWVKRRRAWSYGVAAAFSALLTFLIVMVILVTSPLTRTLDSLSFAILLLWLMTAHWRSAVNSQNRRLYLLATRVIKSEYRLCPHCNRIVNPAGKNSGHHPRCRSSIQDLDLPNFWRQNCPPHWELEMAGIKSAQLSA